MKKLISSASVVYPSDRYWIQNIRLFVQVIKEELIRNIMLAFVIVLVVCLLLIANIATVLLVLSCVIFTLVRTW